MIIIIVIVVIVLFILLYVENDDTFRTDDAYQGVAVSDKFIFVINTNSISKHDKTNYSKLKTKKIDGHANGGIVLNNMLHITNNPKGSNSIGIYDLDLNFVKSIKINVNGSLTWIDFYNNEWWGMVVYYKKDVRKTRLVKFNRKWQIVKEWKWPKKILERLYPYSISGGQFNKRNGLLYLTGHDRQEIYIVRINPNSNILELVSIEEIPFSGQGISFHGGYLYGIDREKREVIKISMIGTNKLLTNSLS